MNEKFVQLLVLLGAIAAIVAASLLVLDRSTEKTPLTRETLRAEVASSTKAQLVPEVAKITEEVTKAVSGLAGLIEGRIDRGRIRRRDVIAAFCEEWKPTQIMAKYGYERNAIEDVIRKQKPVRDEC